MPKRAKKKKGNAKKGKKTAAEEQANPLAEDSPAADSEPEPEPETEKTEFVEKEERRPKKGKRRSSSPSPKKEKKTKKRKEVGVTCLGLPIFCERSCAYFLPPRSRALRLTHCVSAVVQRRDCCAFTLR